MPNTPQGRRGEEELHQRFENSEELIFGHTSLTCDIKTFSLNPPPHQLSEMLNELDPNVYTVVWIATLEIEAQAALHMLDSHHQGRFSLDRGDDYVFRAGDLGGHNIIIATLPAGQEYGTGSAAALASQVKKFFPNLWFGLLVGVAAGLPDLSRQPPRDIRLGDVLVGLPEGTSAGLIAYDLGKETGDNGFQLLHYGHVLANTETVVRSAIQNIKLMAPRDTDTFLPHYESIRDKDHANGAFNDPGQDHDHLYETDDTGAPNLIQRQPRPDSARTRVWYGPIGSGEKLMKNSQKRNELRDKYGIIGLEMEAAGTMNRIPVGVVRGVCDYGDEHKNKQWQPYAAAMAAAYAKAVLYEIRPRTSILGSVKYDKRAETPFQGFQSGVPILTTFLGREAELSEMKQCLSSDLSRKCLVIWGLGGSGKTQLAAHYVTTNKQAYQSVLWIDSSSSALIHQSFEKLSSQMPVYRKGRPAVEQVIEWLERGTNRSWIMVFDGVPGAHDVDEPEDFDIRKYLPACQHGHILLVTTASDLHMRLALPDIHLEGVDQLTGSKIVLRCARIHAPDDSAKVIAQSISRKLGGLPLALEQAGTFLSYGLIRMNDFNQHFQERFSDKTLKTPMQKYVGSYEKGRTLWAVFEMAYDGLGQRNPHAIKLLHLAAFLTTGSTRLLFSLESAFEETFDSTSKSLFPPGIAETQPFGVLCWLKNLRSDMEQFGTAIHELETSGFVKLSRSLHDTSIESCVMHALIRAFIRSKASEGDIRDSLATAVLLSGQYLQYETERFDLARLWKHAGELHNLLKILFSEVPEFFSQDPDGKYFALLGSVAPIYAHTCRFLGNLQEAKQLWDIVLKYRLVTDPEWPSTEFQMDEILEAAKIDVKLGDFESGIPRYEMLLAHCDRIFPNNDALAVQFAASLRETRESSQKVQKDLGRAILAQRLPKRRPGDLTSPDVSSSLPKPTERRETALADGLANDEFCALLHRVSQGANLGEMDKIPSLLERGAEIDHQDTKGDTALIRAAGDGHDMIVQSLLQHGANPNVQNNTTRSTALICAVSNGHETVVKSLLEHAPNLDLADGFRRTALIWAVRKSQYRIVILLLSYSPQLDIQGDRGATALIWAARKESYGIVGALLASGAELNVRDYSGATALIWAARNGHDGIVRELLDSGADLKVQDHEGGTALICAACHGKDETVRVLLDSGADLNVQDNNGATALIRAARNGHDGIVRELLDSGADLNVQDKHGRTALSWAVRKGRGRIVSMLTAKKLVITRKR